MTSSAIDQKFEFIGFDFRLGDSNLKSVDALIWSMDEPKIEEFISSSKGRLNQAQLLDGETAAVERMACGNTWAVAVGVSSLGLQQMEDIFGPSEYGTTDINTLIDRGWELAGYDVADINGFFSIFEIDGGKLVMNNFALFSSIIEAEALVEKADIKYPSHSPFAVFCVLVFRV